MKGYAIGFGIALGVALSGFQNAEALTQNLAQAGQQPAQAQPSQAPQSQQAPNPQTQPQKGKSGDNLPCVSRQMQVNAPVDKVWQAIQDRRKSDPAHRQLLSYDGNVAVIKETFPSMPVLGTGICTYTEREFRPVRRIVYSMVASPKFRTFEGCWTLTPGSAPNTTLVTLSFTFDPGIRFPLWDRIAKGSMNKNVKDTIQEVNKLATAQ